MTDVWDDSASESEMFERNWNRLQDTHGTVGYREGLVEGQEKHIQQGFDDGYTIGATVGLEIGMMQGVLATMDSAEALELLKVIQQLKWDDLFKQYFKNGNILLIDDIKSRYDAIVGKN
jgi:hypothetical protein